ncbi:MAG: Na(+)-translocating NADH-quinone reductase subunit A [Alistipes sp.]|nr:Na(+)-translocating NADH-quinone reductase subunit A [Candidatus Alistipes equi]
MSKIIKLSKGLDIRLEGEAQKSITDVALASQYAVSPLDFENLVPKMLVKVGDKVKAGSSLFFDKNCPAIVFPSPVSGTVSAVNRGEKRRILSVVIDADQDQQYESFDMVDPKVASRDDIVCLLLKSGLWTLLVQRPYGVLAQPADMPKAIFVSAFDTAPLAPCYNFIMESEKEALQKGFQVLSRLTSGKVHLGYNAKCEAPSFEGVELHAFQGKHPAGNVGVQIHHICPISKGEKVWTMNYQDVAILGRFFLTGKVDLHRTIALAGSSVKNPSYYRIISGIKTDAVLSGQLKEDHVRVISGDVLTGRKLQYSDFIGLKANMLTVIPEGDTYEFMGWAMPRFKKFSVSRAYFSWLCPKKKYTLDTNLNGGVRPFVVTGLYEKYLPMDIYPMHLLKAIIAEDIDKMESLGIYEVIEEDIALCEFVDPSKIEMQQILRNGINALIKEGE